MMRFTLLLTLALSLLYANSCSEYRNINQSQPEDRTAIQTSKTISLRETSPFPFGAALNPTLLKNNSDYRNLVIRQFNSLTPENVMKFGHIHPSRNQYKWEDADYLVSFAEDHDMRVHGHTLIWHQNLPTWIQEFKGTAAQWEDLFKSHIQDVVKRYKGKVHAWDVVNEAIDNDGNGLRSSIWLEHIGADYIEKAFIYAHEADPDALLFYNDYGHEFGPRKRNAVLNLVNDLIKKDVPIHGIGLQMHTRITRENNLLKEAIVSAANTGLMVHISELDIAANHGNNPKMEYTPEIASQLAEKYRYIVEVYKSLPKEQQYGITSWNVSDADTWITRQYNRPDWPLLFDTNYEPKQAYFEVINALNKR